MICVEIQMITILSMFRLHVYWNDMRPVLHCMSSDCAFETETLLISTFIFRVIWFLFSVLIYFLHPSLGTLIILHSFRVTSTVFAVLNEWKKKIIATENGSHFAVRYLASFYYNRFEHYTPKMWYRLALFRAVLFIYIFFFWLYVHVYVFLSHFVCSSNAYNQIMQTVLLETGFRFSYLNRHHFFFVGFIQYFSLWSAFFAVVQNLSVEISVEKKLVFFLDVFFLFTWSTVALSVLGFE